VKTSVYICFNGAAFDYVFDAPLDIFIKSWNNQINGCGYFVGYDINQKYIIINPSNCGLVEFSNAK
jgi:hypothetical protein